MLAPMEGVIDSVTRSLYSEIGGYDRLVTEFIRVTDKLLPDHVFYKYAPELKNAGLTKEGLPVFVQLLGGQPLVIAENAAKACALGAPGIDLNFGCPAPTVNRHDGGATLLKNPSRLFDIISSVRKSVPSHIPVTAKVRLGFDHKENIVQIAQAVEAANADMLTVHARTRSEGYKPPAHWQYIRIMKEHLVNTKLVANGEIWNVDDYLNCKNQSGCEDVALGRGAIAKPDLALQIRNHFDQSKKELMNWEHIQKTLLPEFILRSSNYRDHNYAIARTKQWLRQLARQYPKAELGFEVIKRLHHTEEIKTALRNL